MKKLIAIVSFLFFLGLSVTTYAQENKVKHVGHEIKKGAVKAGNKTAQIASKGKARVTDKVYKGKVGPAGQTIYIDDHSRYYWIDKRGHRNYVIEAELKDKM
jgi:hypothetical protein